VGENPTESCGNGFWSVSFETGSAAQADVVLCPVSVNPADEEQIESLITDDFDRQHPSGMEWTLRDLTDREMGGLRGMYGEAEVLAGRGAELGIEEGTHHEYSAIATNSGSVDWYRIVCTFPNPDPADVGQACQDMAESFTAEA